MTDAPLAAVPDGASGAPVHSLEDRLIRSEAANQAMQERLSENSRLSELRDTILEALPAHVALIDGTGTILAANRSWTAFAALSGFQPAPFGVGSNYLDALAENQLGLTGAADALEGIRRVLNGRTQEFQLDRQYGPNTDSRWFHMVATPVKDRAPIGAIVTHIDITATRAAQAQSRIDGRLLELAVDAAAIGIWEFTPGRPLQWNDRMYELYAIEPGSELHYADWASLLHPDDTELEQDALTAIRAAGGKREREFRMMSRLGIEHYVQTVEQATYRPDGTLERIVGTHIDVTEPRHQDMEIRRANSRLETLIAEATIGIAVHQGGLPIMVNTELSRMFGYEDKDAFLKLGDLRASLIDADRQRFDTLEQGLMSGTQEPAYLLCRGNRRDGTIVDLEARLFVIEWDGGRSVCTMVTDISDRRVMEAQLRESQKLEAIGQMTGGIAHDFNNLLTVILGNGELLEAGLQDNPALRSLAATTLLAAERGAELTSNLLAFARRQHLHPSPVAINELIRGIMPLLRHAVGPQVEILTTCEAEPWLAFIDPAQLESALLNLFVNARDAMPDGGTLKVLTSNRQFDLATAGHAGIEPGSYVEITVLDTGTGMTEETRRRAFDLFFTTKDVGKGSGLGLSMVYGFVKQSRGNITINSAPGAGTRISLFLPRADAGEARGSPRAEQPTMLALGNERILVVEDDELVREQTITQLTLLGYNVVSATDAAQALELLHSAEEFALLFTDVVMPGGMNGRQLADAAKLLKPDIAVLFTSGYTDETTGEIAAGIDGAALLGKPYRRQQLATMVRETLDGRRSN